MATTVADSYHQLRDSRRLLLTRDEMCWFSGLDGPPQQSDVIINFGCGLQLTPHLMLETLDVLEALGVTPAAVAGPQWCCGMQVESDEEPGAGTDVVRSSVRRMAQFQPHTTVQSCGAWWPQIAKLRGYGEVVPFDLEHMTQFIMEAVQGRRDTIAWRTTSKTRVLLHLKAHDLSPEERAERADAMTAINDSVPAILRMIPSLSIVGDAEPPSLGAPCEMDDDDRGILDTASPEQREHMRAELVEQGARAGADTLVCAHHQCFREWGKLDSDRLAVRHYISVLADAMGLARPDRFHICCSLPTIEDIVDETEPAWRSWGVGRAEATSLASRLFPSHPRSSEKA